MTSNLRRKTVQSAPQIPTSAAQMKPICAADETHLRRRWDPSAPQIAPSAPHIRPICAADRHICAAAMCDLRRLHVRSAWRSRCSSRAARRAPAAALPRGCGGRQRPLAVHPRTRRANPGILKWWQVRRLASCRTPRHGGYSTPSLVTRRRRRVTSFAFPSGGAPTGASLQSTPPTPLSQNLLRTLGVSGIPVRTHSSQKESRHNYFPRRAGDRDAFWHVPGTAVCVK